MSAPPAVVVTGASSGIGNATALLLDARGFRVFAGVRRESDAAALRGRASDRLTPVRLDVTSAGDVAAAVALVEDATGDAGLAGLVNNAGIAIGAPLEFVPLAALRRQLEVNVVGPVALLQGFLPALRRARGRVVNVGSIAGRSTVPFIAPYAASKHALEALSDALRVELMPFGVDVVLIEPGAVATPIWERSLAASNAMVATEADAAAASPRVHALPHPASDAGRAEAIDPARAALLESLYGPALNRLRRYVEGSPERGIPADVVARAILHALRARRPRTRYLLGRDARLRLLLRWLPDRWRDHILADRIWGRARGGR